MTIKTVFLAGASRGVGREIAKRLANHHLNLIALLRDPTYKVELEALGIAVVLGDAIKIADIEKGMSDFGQIDAVISTIGGLPKDGIRADYAGNKNLIDAAVKVGVKKFILVSSIGSGSSAGALSPEVLQALSPVLVEKDKAEQYLIASGLTYTVVRPGGLKSESATGRGILTEDPTISGSIQRADVASLVCQCLVSDRANHKIFSALDRDCIWTPKPFEEFKIV
jgi:uncharacterized protein YbjT (DUF2867 family)